MARIAKVDAVVVKPQSNLYTALAAVATLATGLGLVIVFIKAGSLFTNGLFGG